MKYIPFIKKNLKSLFKENIIIIISFVIGPLLISLIYGTMMEKIYDGTGDIEEVNVMFSYNEDSQNGRIFKEILDNEYVKDFINENDDCAIEVQISDDFNDINIKNIKADSKEITLVKGFMEEVSCNLNKYEVISDKISNPDKLKAQEILNNYISKMQNAKDSSLFNKKLIDGYKTLNSWEYYGISIFTFTSVLILVTFTNSFFKDKREGIIRRTLSACVSKKDYIISFFLCSFIDALIINSIYVFLVRISNISFKGNIIGLAAVVLGQSLLQSAIACVIVSIFKSKKVINLVLITFIAVSSILGGSFYSLDFVDNNLLQVLKKISPNTLILNAYKYLSISSNQLEFLRYVAIMCVIAVILLGISIVKVNYRWEEI